MNPDLIDLIDTIISTIVPIVLALFSLFIARSARRQSAQFERIIEAQRLSDKHLEKSLASLGVAVQVIQHVKDEIQLILAAVDSSLDTETAIERITAARQDLFDCYKNELSQLDKMEGAACHRAKTKALEIETFIKKSLQNKENASDLSPEERLYLWELRSQITDFQHLLRDSRTDRLVNRLKRE